MHIAMIIMIYVSILCTYRARKSIAVIGGSTSALDSVYIIRYMGILMFCKGGKKPVICIQGYGCFKLSACIGAFLKIPLLSI